MGWRGRGSLRPASERRTKKNSPKKRKGPSTRRRGGGGSRPEREKRRFEEPCEDQCYSVSLCRRHCCCSFCGVSRWRGGEGRGRERGKERSRREREREKKRSTITKKKMSNFRGLVASQKTEGKEPFRDRKEPVLSLPAAANSRPLSGQNPLLVSTFVDLFPPSDATEPPKELRRLPCSARQFNSSALFSSSRYRKNRMQRRSTFQIAALACLCCLIFSAEAAAAGRALLKENKFNIDEMFYGPADASIVAAEVSPATAGPPTAAAAATTATSQVLPPSSSSAPAPAAPAAAAAAVVVVVASPPDPAAESESPFVAPADASAARARAPAPVAASGRRLSEQHPEAAAAAAAPAPAGGDERQPLASAAAARLPSGYIAPSPGDSVASIERGLRKQQGS